MYIIYLLYTIILTYYILKREEKVVDFSSNVIIMF